MKTITSLMDFYQSELINAGNNEFVNKVEFDDPIKQKTQLTMHSDDFTFIRKIARYDDDVAKITTNNVFRGFTFNNADEDQFFKKTFINRFLDREIHEQTMDLFSNHLVSFVLLNEDLIDELYVNGKQFYEGGTSGTTKNTNGNNSVDITLAQDNVNLDLHADTADYADTNRIYRGFSDNETNSLAFSPDAIDNMKDQWEQLMLKFDRKLFLQTW